MIAITVNGVRHELDIEPEMPLLWVLRDEIGLVGTKFGCGIAQCGACTVHVNGAATQACAVTLDSVAGAAITTIEGLSPDGSHAVQRAWVEHEFNLVQWFEAEHGGHFAALEQPEIFAADVGRFVQTVRSLSACP